MNSRPESAVAPVITIDGPSGSGKGTLSRLLARRLGWHWLDSGALYRLLALAATQDNIALEDVAALVDKAHQLDIRFEESADGEPQIYLSGQRVTDALRTEQCGKVASKVAAIPAVRAALLDRQRAFRQLPGLVADGRDMGTVVFPDADLKIFLDASIEERANRRQKQLKKQGLDISMGDLFQEISARDQRDMNRAVSPLRPAEDAKHIDCSAMTIDEMLETALGFVREKGWVAAG